MNHGSLFSGIGGWNIAADEMGWETVFNCEIDSFCQRVLKYYWPKAKLYEDIKKTDFSKWKGQIDILTNSFPCQGFSLAGKRKGTKDNRYLWPESLRAIQEIQPEWVISENVPGIINIEGGMVFEQVHADLEASGYEIITFILPACGVGAWHRRDRIWIVAYKNSNKRNTDKGKSNTKTNRWNYTRRICKDVPDTESTKCEQSGDTWTRRDRFTNSCKDVPHTDNQGSQRRNGRELSECSIKQSFGKGNTQDNGTDGQSESRLGRMVDGLSPWLDEPDIPRVATGIKDRVNRLKGLGNSIVPQVALEIFKAIDKLNQQL